jgi:gluconolactonase
MTVEIRDPAFTGVVGRSAECEMVADGFAFIEGPLWNAQQRCLLFSDIPGNRIHRWSAAAGVTTFREPSHMANGLTADRQGRLVACEHATSRVTRTEADGRVTVLASHFEGKELNSPNDVVVKSDGAIYFSDPSYGRMAYYGVARDCELEFRGVYRVDANGKDLTLLAHDFGQPNGLCFSPDEALLFVNDTERRHIRVFDVAVDGTLAGGRVWANVSGNGPGAPDGMKIDSQGNLYCTGPGGIHVFDSAATCLGVIHVPENAANFTWGDADLCSLLITATHSLYLVRVAVPGCSL